MEKSQGFIQSEESYTAGNLLIHKVRVRFPFDEPRPGYGSGPDYFIQYAIDKNTGNCKLMKIEYESNGCGMGDQGGTNWKEGETPEKAVRELIRMLDEVRKCKTT